MSADSSKYAQGRTGPFWCHQCGDLSGPCQHMQAPMESAVTTICALTFWTNRVASALHSYAAGESVDGHPYEELIAALERLHSITKDQLLALNPLWAESQSGNLGQRL